MGPLAATHLLLTGAVNSFLLAFHLGLGAFAALVFCPLLLLLLLLLCRLLGALLLGLLRFA
jgi:hypothetical protein